MDFKGITWVGNVYQKFEAMCLEVEEIIVQDTAKYVENQVQTVGASVKKFYSDVVQDLLPESSVDSGKPYMLHEYAPVCSFTKKKESLNGEAADVQQEQLTKDETWVIRDQGKSDGSATKCRGLQAGEYSLCTSPRQFSSDSGPYRRTKLGAKRISQKEKVHKVTRPHVEKDSRLTTGNIPREKDLDMETVSSNDSPAESKRSVSREPSHEDNGNGQNEQGLTAVDSIRSRNSKSEQSATASLPAGSEYRAEETDEDSLDMNRVWEQNTEIIQQLSQRPVEESCILVDRDEAAHCVVPLDNKHGKRKSYKKIRDAVYSRMRPSREQEYKRLAGQWCAEEAETGLECGDNRKELAIGTQDNRLSVQQMNESDWELL